MKRREFAKHILILQHHPSFAEASDTCLTDSWKFLWKSRCAGGGEDKRQMWESVDDR